MAPPNLTSSSFRNTSGYAVASLSLSWPRRASRKDHFGEDLDGQGPQVPIEPRSRPQPLDHLPEEAQVGGHGDQQVVLGDRIGKVLPSPLGRKLGELGRCVLQELFMKVAPMPHEIEISCELLEWKVL